MVAWYTIHQGLDYPSRHSGDGIRWLEKRWLGALSTKGWTPDAHQWGDHLLLVTIFYWALSFTGRYLLLGAIFYWAVVREPRWWLGKLSTKGWTRYGVATGKVSTKAFMY